MYSQELGVGGGGGGVGEANQWIQLIFGQNGW